MPGSSRGGTAAASRRSSGYFVILAIARVVVSARGDVVGFATAESFAAVVVVPLTSTFIYFLAVFTFGLSGDLMARQSMFPARMFTLPVTSSALTAQVMACGAVAMLQLWFGTRSLSLWPAGADVPWIWPALLGVVLLTWTQALTWMSYGLPGLRVLVTVLWLAAIDAVVFIALERRVHELLMLALLLPHLPLAYVTARRAVVRARRGDVPDWTAFFKHLAHGRVARKPAFGSPLRAQVWFEWRRHGRSLPALTALVIPFELGLLFVFPETPSIILGTFAAVLLTPAFLASFVAATVSKSSERSSDGYGPTPFLATRPLTTASFVRAKVEVTIRSTLLTSAIVLAATPLALWLSGTAPVITSAVRDVVDVIGLARTAAIIALSLLGVVATTWKQLVQSLYVGMTGRGWAIRASVFVPLAALAAGVPIILTLSKHAILVAIIWKTFTWLIPALVLLKTLGSAAVLAALRDRRLIESRTMFLAVAAWELSVFALYGVLAWIFPEVLVRHYLLAFMAILLVPILRLSAAPLALAWNRHR